MEEVTQRGQPRRTSAGGTQSAGIGQWRRDDTIDRSTVPISWAVMDPSPSLSKISNASLRTQGGEVRGADGLLPHVEARCDAQSANANAPVFLHLLLREVVLARWSIEGH